MAKTVDFLVRRYVAILSKQKYGEPLFLALCFLNALLAAGVTLAYYYLAREDATFQVIMGVVAITIPSFFAYFFYKALCYSIGRGRLEQALQAICQRRYHDAFVKLYEFKAPINHELLMLPSVAYIYGIALRSSGDKRSVVFTEYAALHDHDLRSGAGETVDPDVIKRKLDADLRTLSKSTFFNAVDRKGLLKFIIWTSVGIAVVHLIHLTITLFQKYW
jgi:hypothetical protein